MRLLLSEKVKIPTLFLIHDRKEIVDLPIGTPFILADAEIENELVRILEYETLYQNAVRTGFKFDFPRLLKEAGFDDMRAFDWDRTYALEYVTDGVIEKSVIEDYEFSADGVQSKFKEFVKDNSCLVDMQVLKSLNIFPIWLDVYEKAVTMNVNNYLLYDYNLYNKKLDGVYGALISSSPTRNLIIIDISGSIPRAVSVTCLASIKHMAESFFCDVLITGSKSTLYLYENLHTLNIDTIYDENEMDNDQTYFKNLVESEKRVYNTVIAFGDDHSPCYPWSNTYNRDNNTISKEDGKKLCKWEFKKGISFHTTSTRNLVGYLDWFEFEDGVEHMTDWVKYF